MRMTVIASGLGSALLITGVLGAWALGGPAASQSRAAPARAPDGSCASSSCHGALVAQPHVHPPATDDCTICHSRKGQQHAFTLLAAGSELCTSCHADPKTPENKFIHGPVAAGECTVCHNPHGSPNPKFVRAPGSELCKGCHVEMRARIAEHRYTHAPVNQACALCHSPHASPFRYQLKAEGSDLCLGCHTALKKAIETAPVTHDATRIERQCLNCHDPHVTDLRPQLRGPTRTLCLSCHNKEIRASDDTILPNIKAWLEANPDAHGPIRQDDCAACHRPHDSPRFRLLRADYPPQFYSGFDPRNYALCFTCHQPDLAQVERTTTLTGFRNQDRNLHFVHVNRPEKGRTCRACHQVHASTKPKHIRESVPFGAWSLPINYEKNENGGRCSPGCHVPRQYTRVMQAPS